ncbi:MAG: class I SAM-dependent methyltransferase [Alphaproteobacteria bacterium]|nr:class I SAM-dependent methyltransferase [Alphaproteobacteria bacterium]
MTNFRGLTSQLIKANFESSGILVSATFSYCPICDFGYFYPVPPSNFLNDYYRRESGGRDYDDALKWVNSYSARQPMYEIFSLMRENGIAPEQFSGKKVLEVGCGYSQFIPFATRYGMEVTAIEPGEDFANFIEHVLGVNVMRSMLDELPRDLYGKFCMLFSRDSLEHHPDPAMSIGVMHDLLEPGGLLVLSVPNLHSFSFQEMPFSHPYFAFPAHLNYFSCKALRAHLERIGFAIVYITTTTFIGELAYCMEAAIKLGLIVPDLTVLNQLASQEQLERILVFARRTSNLVLSGGAPEGQQDVGAESPTR